MESKPYNLCYAQSGGVTSVINNSALGVIETAVASENIGQVYAAKNGILGILKEELIQTWLEDEQELSRLRMTPGGIFGSCRVKLPNTDTKRSVYERLFAVLRAHNIRYFLYNGGNDSADTVLKLSQAAQFFDWPLVAVGVPKTIDNDLAVTDVCPGFGSAAKYVAVSVSEVLLDLQSMSRTSTKVFVLEVMGRNAGWIAAAAGLVAPEDGGSILILPPEQPFNETKFVKAVAKSVEWHGHAVVVVSEGIKDEAGEFITASSSTDSFAHQQLGGVASYIANKITDAGYKTHWSVADYLQRSARHISSQVDVEQAYALGAEAVQLALAGKNATIPVIVRISDVPYNWKIVPANLSDIANRERKLPDHFFDGKNYSITSACRRYLQPLIGGKAAEQEYGMDGLPVHARLRNVLAERKLEPYEYPV